MSGTGGNINGTAGSDDVKLVRSVRKRYAKKFDIGGILVREGYTPKQERGL